MTREIEIRNALLPVVVKYGTIDVSLLLSKLVEDFGKALEANTSVQNNGRKPSKDKPTKKTRKVAKPAQYEKSRAKLLAIIKSKPGIRMRDVDGEKLHVSRSQLSALAASLCKEGLIRGEGPRNWARRYSVIPTNGSAGKVESVHVN